MTISKALKATLIISGLIGLYIGVEILLFPVKFYATSGIFLGDNISLLNEIRAPGGALLFSSILIIMGAFVPRLTFTSIILATLLYLSYGASRIFSMAIDGRPVEILIYVSALEIAIGLVCAFMLARFIKSEQQKA
ncbi:MAG: DUF4345 domain-containing protein [Gammaproteobacteria bacterium]|nr:DUF4345 domain-containing protein [Gammaproteobacteria bacterium]MDH5653905.1 DUF4345 domain-containing protein [Gammaproteobacteria bacterium]